MLGVLGLLSIVHFLLALFFELGCEARLLLLLPRQRLGSERALVYRSRHAQCLHRALSDLQHIFLSEYRIKVHDRHGLLGAVKRTRPLRLPSHPRFGVLKPLCELAAELALLLRRVEHLDERK